MVRFQSEDVRDSVWGRRREAKKNGLIVEEWLTEHRARLHKKCKELKANLDSEIVSLEASLILNSSLTMSTRPTNIRGWRK